MMEITRTRRAAIALGTTVVVMAALSGCAANGTSSDENAANSLEITSWWTSGSEEAALNVLIDAVKASDPGLTVDNFAVSGGGGANARQALAARLQAGDPPDSWQVHPGGQLASYVDAGQVADLTDLYEKNGWADLMTPAVAALQGVGGKFYTVPIGVHRGNVLWTNPAVLGKAGVTIDENTTLDELIGNLATIKASGVDAVCLGDKDVFASSELLESLLMSRLGPDNWNDLFTNDFSFDSPEARQALADYSTFLSMANSDHSALTWDEAAKNLAAGKCGVSLMGDWAYGEMVNAGFEPDKDFGWVTLPSDSGDIFDYVGDGFSIPSTNIPNAAAAEAWLKAMMDPKVQVDFAAQKGTIPAITTADISTLSAYQQGSAASFASGAVVSSLTHGQASTAEFSQTYADATTTFNGDLNVEAFIASMTAAQKNL
jgi:glucose/mannose transport system substrate-binding protein